MIAKQNLQRPLRLISAGLRTKQDPKLVARQRSISGPGYDLSAHGAPVMRCGLWRPQVAFEITANRLRGDRIALR